MKTFRLFTAIVVASVGISGNVRAQQSSFYEEPITLLNGDTNGDLSLDVADAVHLLFHLYMGGPAPAILVGCEAEDALQNGDSNGDGSLDAGDAVYLLSHLFLRGPAPREACPIGVAAGATVIVSAGTITAVPPPQPNVCNGDLVFLAGEATTVSRTVILPDGSMSVLLVIRWHALRGTGVPSGTEYIGVGGVTSNLVFGPGSNTTTVVSRITYIDAGGGGNHNALANLHITVNANGEVTVSMSSVTFECTGD